MPKIELDKNQIELLRNALKTEINGQESYIRAWKDNNFIVLKEIYGKKRYKQIISNSEKDLNNLIFLDKLFWKELNRLRDLKWRKRFVLNVKNHCQ